MRTIRHIVSRAPRFVATACLLGPLLSSSEADAQVSAGVEKPPPNVLLLVDTSGSMELKADQTAPVCNALSPGLTNQKSRWIDLVEVLTGRFSNYSCWAQDRNSNGFRSEFSLAGNLPYDVGYINPYTRALSSSCVYGPGVLPSASNPYAFPTRGVNTFTFTGSSVTRPADLVNHTGCAGFNQAPDGLLDVYNNQIRFGLMTFDTHVSKGTGVASGVANYPTGIDGTWSYYLGTPAQGHPTNCAFDMDQEVGARNASAPPWEGRMVAFGSPSASDNTQRNTWIQQVLLSTRPYGATPIAGLLNDARDFLWNDVSNDPLDASATPGQFGPTNDPNWRVPNCRKTIAILLTDGEPNLDLRPFCDAATTPPDTPGRCPYDKPENIASALRLDPPTASMSVETYVVAFALGNVTLSNGTNISCSVLTDAQCAANLNNKPVQACCVLNKIAAAGGFDQNNQPRRAFFADNPDQLRSIFTQILDDVVQVTTRTIPVFSGAGGDSASAGFKFFSAFDPRPDPTSVQLWKGVLERKRFVCNSDLVPEEKFNKLQGDDFAANIASGAGTPRRFYTVIADGGSRNTIRPKLPSTTDGLTAASGSTVNGAAAALASLIPSAKMEVTASTCTGSPPADTCRTNIVNHLVGLSGTYTRCPSTDQCNLLGGLYHSTPQVVPGRPADFLRDESYQNFITTMTTNKRPTVMYTSTVDGFLHAFKVAPFPGETGNVDALANNELWAFLPPAVLPALQAQYPSTPALLLDGVPVIKDVVARVQSGTDLFERLQSDAQVGAGEWRTVLLQGFGEGQVSGGYFALDITKPTSDGPKFLWQLTKTSAGVDLFGTGGTPLITTLFVNAAGGPREVAVAVLPGGNAEPVTGQTDTAIGSVMNTEPSSYKTTRAVQRYTGGERARSLTIVRLDNGEVIRTFRPAGSTAPFSTSVVTETVIPSPIVGQPKAFPPDPGAVADRIFVGDRDGRLWRLDVSSTNPQNWKMEVFFDAFHSFSASQGQPVEIPPILSVNDTGNITIAFATGDQRATAGATSLQNRVVSLTEKLKDGDFVAHVNWVQTLSNAERVTGPMVLFNRGLFYAASRPPNTSTSRCDVGASKVYGAHYELNKSQQGTSGTDDPESGPGTAAGVSSLVIDTRTDGMIFGVSLQAEPSCSSTPAVAAADESFGYGAVEATQTVKPGRFYVSYEVSGTSQNVRGVQDQKLLLSTPRVPVTFESWALIYE